MVGGFLSVPDREQIDCHFPKPILLNTGFARLPYEWDPKSVPISVFRVGQFFILNVPAELTTMAGRRLRKEIRTVLTERGVEDPHITIAGLANSYTHYVTTFEEYAGQRYEAASTLYGPHTLSAYIQEFKRITVDLIEGRESESDEPPDDLSKKQLSLIPPVQFDMIGWGFRVSDQLEKHENENCFSNLASTHAQFSSAQQQFSRKIVIPEVLIPFRCRSEVRTQGTTSVSKALF